MTNEPYEEALLLKRLNAGDPLAFGAVYDKYHQPIYGFVLRFVKVPAIAEDLLQDIFLKLWEARSRLDASRSFNAYLYQISRNHVYTWMKKIAADQALRSQVFSMIAAVEESGQQGYAGKEYDQLLAAAIGHLPPQRQRVFRLCRVEGKKYDEVALELNISRNTVKEHLVLATRAVRDYFQHHAELPLGFLLLLAMARP